MTTVFLAYDNRSHARDGAPIYDCRLMLVVCRQVGTIVHVYNDEDTIEFPLFNVKLSRTMRGVFAEVRFTDSEAKYDDILFAGYKPLLF